MHYICKVIKLSITSKLFYKSLASLIEKNLIFCDYVFVFTLNLILLILRKQIKG